jgi:hypothetical protein
MVRDRFLDQLGAGREQVERNIRPIAVGPWRQAFVFLSIRNQLKTRLLATSPASTLGNPSVIGIRDELKEQSTEGVSTLSHLHTAAPGANRASPRYAGNKQTTSSPPAVASARSNVMTCPPFRRAMRGGSGPSRASRSPPTEPRAKEPVTPCPATTHVHDWRSST